MSRIGHVKGLMVGLVLVAAAIMASAAGVRAATDERDPSFVSDRIDNVTIAGPLGEVEVWMATTGASVASRVQAVLTDDVGRVAIELSEDASGRWSAPATVEVGITDVIFVVDLPDGDHQVIPARGRPISLVRTAVDRPPAETNTPSAPLLTLRSIDGPVVSEPLVPLELGGPAEASATQIRLAIFYTGQLDDPRFVADFIETAPWLDHQSRPRLPLNGADGDRIIAAQVRDAGGRVSTIATARVLLDTPAPIVSSSIPTAGGRASLESGAFRLHGEVIDPFDDVASIVVSAGGETIEIVPEHGGDRALWEVDIAAPTSGLHRYDVTATDSEGNQHTETFELQVELPAADEVVVDDRVVVVEPTDPGIVSFDSLTGTIVATAEFAADLEPGAIIVRAGRSSIDGPAIEPLFDQIEDRFTITDGNVALATRPALWEDVFWQIDTSLVDGDPTTSADPASGFDLAGSDPLLASAAVVSTAFEHEFRVPLDVEVSELPDHVRLGSENEIVARVNFALRVGVKWDWFRSRVQLEHFELAAKADVDGSISMGVGVSAEEVINAEIDRTEPEIESDDDDTEDDEERFELNKEWKFCDEDLGSVAFQAGPLPVYIEFEGECRVGIDADISGSASFVLPYKARAAVGTRYDDGGWQDLNDRHGSFGEPEVSLEFQAEAGVFMAFELEIELYRFGGPEIALGPRLELRAAAGLTSGADIESGSEVEALCWYLSAEVFMKLGVEVDVELFGVTLIDDFEREFLEVTAGVGRWSSDPDSCNDPEPEPQVDPGGEPSEPNPSGGSTSEPSDRNERRTAKSFGDPNLRTFDGLVYPFHRAGDYVFAESLDDDFAVHVRYGRSRNRTTMSFNRAVVANVGGAIVSIGDGDGGGAFDRAQVRVDGRVIEPTSGPTALPNGGEVVFSGRRAQVRWPDGSELEASLSIGGTISLTVAEDRWGRLRGLAGNADGFSENDAATRAGDLVDLKDPAQLYGPFGDGWFLPTGRSLFVSVADPRDILPILPGEAIRLSDLPADIVAQAEQACLDAGVQPGELLEQCTFDVAVSGDERWVQNSLDAATTIGESTPAIFNNAVVEDTISLPVPAVVQPDQPTRGAGRLTAPLQVDRYRMQLEAGAIIDVSFTEPCRPGVGLMVELRSSAAGTISRNAASNCASTGPITVPVGGTYDLLVGDSTGWTGVYGFEIDLVAAGSASADGPLPNPSSTTLASGVPLTISVEEPVGPMVFGSGVGINGSASIGRGSAEGRGNVVYLVDVSGSTREGRLDCNGDGVVDERDNMNPQVDDRLGTILDCALEALRTLNRSLVNTGVDADVSIVVFAERAAAADMSSVDGRQGATPAGADTDGDGFSDVEQVLQSIGTNGVGVFDQLGVRGGTNFEEALRVAADVLEANTTGGPATVIFLSDGADERASRSLTDELDRLRSLGARVDPYSVGSNAAGCEATSRMVEIGTATGSKCIAVEDPTDLAVAVNTAGGDLLAVTVSINGAQAELVPVNPLGGWSLDLAALAPGRHRIDAIAQSIDGTQVATTAHITIVPAP